MNKPKLSQTLLLKISISILICLGNQLSAQVVKEAIVSTKTLSGWKTEGEGLFKIQQNSATTTLRGIAPKQKLYWQPANDTSAGTLRSGTFTIGKAMQEFDIAGGTGFDLQKQAQLIRLRLRASHGGEVLRQISTNGYATLSTERWYTPDLIGKKVFLEIYAPALVTFFGVPDVWMSLENYRQVDFPDYKLQEKVALQGVPIDAKAHLTFCRSMPFLAADPAQRGSTKREIKGPSEFLPVHARADMVYLLGMINHGWENGVAHWSEHTETLQERNDQVYIGKQLGTLVFHYVEGEVDSIPLVFGANMWFSNHWSHGASHEVSLPTREPFASREDYMSRLRNTLLVKEDLNDASFASDYKQYYLAIRPRSVEISSIEVINDLDTRGQPLISAITLQGAKQKSLHAFGNQRVEKSDLEARIDVSDPPDYRELAASLADLLYTYDKDLPEDPDWIELPEALDATSIRFLGGKEAGWLSNVWAANLAQIHEKFDPETGYFMETGPDCPFYAGYSGMGTWSVQGIYPAAYSRTSDHFATLAMRHINLPQRETSFVDFCDTWLYFYRNNRDPEKGPPNELLDLDRYPKDAPPHWSMELSKPPTTGGALNVNEIHGDEEMDGHASTIVGRWFAWKLQGGSTGDWLSAPRSEVYGHSRWESTLHATEFICWLMDYTGRDLVYSEGEFTGWGGIMKDFCLVPKGMSTETNPEKIRENYANANMYEPYPNYACLVALKCAAEMADSIGSYDLAEKWRMYAANIRDAMLRQLVAGDFNQFTWRISPYSVLTTFQDRLVQAWFSLYIDGLDTRRWDQEMLTITRNTFHEHMAMPYGHAPVLAMGYGQGWLTHASLLLDEMDHAGKLLVNAARYTYDKNMDYVDEPAGIDWRKWRWIVPEGVNLLPDGGWHRINDLSNGANQGPIMHALEASAGVDDTDPGHIRIMPRIPDPLEGINVDNHFVLIPGGDEGLIKARLSFEYVKDRTFALISSDPIPKLSVRLGPWSDPASAAESLKKISQSGLNCSLEKSGIYKGKDAWWIWVESLENREELNIVL